MSFKYQTALTFICTLLLINQNIDGKPLSEQDGRTNRGINHWMGQLKGHATSYYKNLETLFEKSFMSFLQPKITYSLVTSKKGTAWLIPSDPKEKMYVVVKNRP